MHILNEIPIENFFQHTHENFATNYFHLTEIVPVA